MISAAPADSELFLMWYTIALLFCSFSSSYIQGLCKEVGEAAQTIIGYSQEKAMVYKVGGGCAKELTQFCSTFRRHIASETFMERRNALQGSF